MATPSKVEIIQAYRSLRRASLRAVQSSNHAKLVIFSRLRHAFSTSPVSDFDARRISNTVLFLENAAKDRGIEHKIVKNLVQIWGTQKKQWEIRHNVGLTRTRRKRTGIGGEEEGGGLVCQAYDQVWWTLGMLNESLGLCLR
jgi:hypothetical protein